MSTLQAEALLPESIHAEVSIPEESARAVQVIATPTAQVVFVQVPGIQGPRGPKGEPGDAAPLKDDPTEIYLKAKEGK